MSVIIGFYQKLVHLESDFGRAISKETGFFVRETSQHGTNTQFFPHKQVILLTEDFVKCVSQYDHCEIYKGNETCYLDNKEGEVVKLVSLEDRLAFLISTRVKQYRSTQKPKKRHNPEITPEDRASAEVKE